VRNTGDNPSEAAMESRIRQLARLDWANKPSRLIMDQLGIGTASVLCDYRHTEVYAEELALARAEWHEEMSRVPDAVRLRKEIQQAMALGVNRIISIIADDSSKDADAISAAKLAAQLDGRFLRGDGEDAKPSDRVDSLAQELLDAIDRQRKIQVN
jgi:hypothetical protein